LGNQVSGQVVGGLSQSVTIGYEPRKDRDEARATIALLVLRNLAFSFFAAVLRQASADFVLDFTQTLRRWQRWSDASVAALRYIALIV
jgi:hypothetical protein